MKAIFYLAFCFLDVLKSLQMSSWRVSFIKKFLYMYMCVCRVSWSAVQGAVEMGALSLFAFVLSVERCDCFGCCVHVPQN